MLKAIRVKGKEYSVSEMTRVLMENGIVEIIYSPPDISNNKKIIAKFHECEFMSDKDGG